MTRIKLAGIIVNDQANALAFYTENLGFTKKDRFGYGDFRWLTVTTADYPDRIELLPDPHNNQAATAFQQSVYGQGIPTTTFMVDDINNEYYRLKQQGVEFKAAPQNAGNVTVAILNDTRGNWIQLYQVD